MTMSKDYCFSCGSEYTSVCECGYFFSYSLDTCPRLKQNSQVCSITSALCRHKEFEKCDVFNKKSADF
jgi:hypothetical protein